MNDLIFAIREGMLVSIDDVEKGAQCGCICPSCGEKLVAKKGNIKAHHFAHITGSNCAYGYETSLHRLAKDLIEKIRYITLPAVKVGNDVILYQPCKARIQSIKLEKKLDSVRPDILVEINNKVLAIEIYVTHKVDLEKIKKIKDNNLPTIEINLSKSLKTENNAEDIKNLLIEILSNDYDSRKYWVYNEKKYNYIKENKLEKNVIYYFGIPFVRDCLEITRYLYDEENYKYKDFRRWINVLEKCKNCYYFLEFDGETVLCSLKDVNLEETQWEFKLNPIIFDLSNNEPIISNCSNPQSYDENPSIKKCLSCPNFISGNKESIVCALDQK